MAHPEPGVALATCEQALRRLISTALADEIGESWLEEAFSASKLAEWRKRMAEEDALRQRRGLVEIPAHEFEYAYFYDLVDIIKQRWDSSFVGAWGGLKRAEVLALLGQFDRLRNPIAHSRELLPFEQDLLSGIAGYVRNRVTIYMSERTDIGSHFARVESVTDSFGNAVRDPSEAIVENEPAVVLRPGDSVRFVCRGTDPLGRDLRWWIRTDGSGRTNIVEGAEAELDWYVDEQHVGEPCRVEIAMSSDSRHHRMGFGTMQDASVIFHYTVLPPS